MINRNRFIVYPSPRRNCRPNPQISPDFRVSPEGVMRRGEPYCGERSCHGWQGLDMQAKQDCVAPHALNNFPVNSSLHCAILLRLGTSLGRPVQGVNGFRRPPGASSAEIGEICGLKKGSPADGAAFAQGWGLLR